MDNTRLDVDVDRLTLLWLIRTFELQTRVAHEEVEVEAESHDHDDALIAYPEGQAMIVDILFDSAQCAHFGWKGVIGFLAQFKKDKSFLSIRSSCEQEILKNLLRKLIQMNCLAGDQRRGKRK